MCLNGDRQRWRRNVLEGLEVVDDVVSDQRATTKSPPIDDSDAERRMEVFVLWQLLQDRRVETSLTWWLHITKGMWAHERYSHI